MIHENKNIASYFCYLTFSKLLMNKKIHSKKINDTDDEFSNLFYSNLKVPY